jgi:hypothetical protein
MKKNFNPTLGLVLFLVLMLIPANDIRRGYCRVGPKYGPKHSVYRTVDPVGFWISVGPKLALFSVGATFFGYAWLARRPKPASPPSSLDLPGSDES